MTTPTLCPHRDPARKCEVCELEAEIADLRERFRHYHEQAEDLSDTACRKCGLDMRNPIHRRKEGGGEETGG